MSDDHREDLPVALGFDELGEDGQAVVREFFPEDVPDNIEIWVAPASNVIRPDDGDNEKPIMTFVSACMARRSRDFADSWGEDLDVGPNGILHELLKHGRSEYERALGLVQTVEVEDPSTDAQQLVNEVERLREADRQEQGTDSNHSDTQEDN